MNGRTATGRQRLAEAIEKAHAAVQDAHAALYAVELAVERAENDVLAAAHDPDVMLGMADAPASADKYQQMRTRSASYGRCSCRSRVG
jgi:hypothetical protein